MSIAEQVFVVGHRNPDTDSICSAIAYANLCQRQGRTNVIPGRAGSLNRQAEFVLESDLRRALSGDELDVERIRSLLDEAKWWGIDLDTAGLSYLFEQTLEEMMTRFVSAPDYLALLHSLVQAVELIRSIPLEVDLWMVQNLYYEMLQTNYPEFQGRAKGGDETAGEWVTQFSSLGEQLSIQVA